ncbi:RIP metalloprotease RseP [Sulfurimonas sp. HSL3-7]|uniref:RIP metalloprotease RseP n=1 Tax=Sulfonitrofixus jiaomeiensis TaxID=3131938 RepID=UPI0031F763D9
MGWLVSLVVLSALIFFHELGHYLAARFFGVYVEVFSVGFGKKVASFRLFNTEWRIAMIPLGGYVRMKGQDDLDPTAISSDSDSYNAKAPWQRIMILAAGPAANFVIAFFLYLFIGLGSPQVLAPVVGDVVKDSPAFVGGVESNDTIKAINGREIATWEEMSTIIKESSGTLDLTIERGNYIQHLQVTPTIQETTNLFNERVHRRMVGIGSAGVATTLDLNLFESIGYAAHETYKASTLIFKGVQKLITGDVPAKELGGAISIVKITADASENGWMAVFFFAALISVNLGVLNLLPIPALDGGHIMFNLYEMITKRMPSEAVLYKLTILGWALLLGLMTLGIYNDINRLMQ